MGLFQTSSIDFDNGAGRRVSSTVPPLTSPQLNRTPVWRE
jgi:hypothetical protein